MCGIAGWFSQEPVVKDRDEKRLNRMVDAIIHRGPDGRGVLLDGSAALGHARLSIIDLDEGKQPMSHLEHGVHIVFNGEIYNYKSLRNDLLSRGYVFTTHSDTEVILALYVEHGVRGFNYLRGMFAIALWDRKRGRAYLVRDEPGIKPLFYTQERGEIIFASEAKSLLARDGLRAQLKLDSLHLLMNFRYLPGSASLFEGVQQLQPGTILEWRTDGSTRTHTLDGQAQQTTGQGILESLEESVRLHLTADVEVASYLSGGIDSACLTALAVRNSDARLRSFTLAVGDDPDEAANASITADILGVDNIQGVGDPSTAALLPHLVWHLEVPKVNSFQVSQLAQLAAGHVKVALSGLGGDELFLGYNAHKILAQLDRLNACLPSPVSRTCAVGLLGLQQMVPSPVWSEKERACRMLGELGNWSRVYGLLRNVWDTVGLREKIYGPRLLDSKLPDAYQHLDALWPEERDPVVAAARFEWQHKMVNDLLWQEDRCSMAVGLEVRVPFLDPVFTRRVQQMSRSELMPGRQPKGFMKNMLCDLLPKEIMNRPKSGFQVDASSFFNQRLKSLADYWLSEERVKSYGLFNPEFVRSVRAYPNGVQVRWHYFMLYLMLMSHLWVELFEQGKSPTDLAEFRL